MVVIFNPADITGLTTLIHSGLAPNHLATLAALDSTRLQTALAQHFGVPQDAVTGCRTYGGHGEQMAVFASSASVSGRPLTDLLGTRELPESEWKLIQEHVRQGGRKIIELRGRSSFQSPAHVSVLMVKAVIEGEGFDWPCGAYIDSPVDGFEKIIMAMETTLDRNGLSWEMPDGTKEEMDALRESYQHLVRLRDEVISFGVLPPLEDWGESNPNLG